MSEPAARCALASRSATRRPTLASSGHHTHTVCTQKNVVETFVDVVPSCICSGLLYTTTTTSNTIEHCTVFNDGQVHPDLPRRAPSPPCR